MKLFLLFFLFISLRINAQISPGDLTNAHADLEGLSNCTRCHEIGERVKNSNCLNCHTEVSELIQNGRGYHSSINVKGKNCSDCHSEHHGRNFRIVNFNSAAFDHSKTTFPLSGKHTRIKCNECHKTKNITLAEARKKNAEWMGLTVLCSGCHIDYHQGTLGSDCKNCHNTEVFRPSLFQHDKAKFKLTGAHIKVKCIECHPVEKRQGKDFQKFTGIRFSTCEGCHRDVHEGKLGNNCSSCHSTNSFRSVNQDQFDHSKTDFHLLGKHKTVNCNSCHKNNFTENIRHEKCTDCHKDYHEGEFIINNISKECSECHSENGFSPSSYSIDDHNRNKFPLTGSHLAVNCAGCHLKDNKWKFREIGIECKDCHKNIHENEIEEKFYSGEGCRNCHSTAKWNTINFDHNKTEFALAGKHLEVNCRKCHFIKDNISVQKFRSLDSYCTECHEDVHVRQFGFGETEECFRCHTFENWKPDRFDHNKTKFSLEGAHSRLNCSSCHKQVTTEGKTFIKYKLEDFRCASCHS